MMRRNERKGTIDAQEYQEGFMRFYTKHHILNVDGWLQEAIESLMQMAEDQTAYRATYVRTPFVP